MIVHQCDSCAALSNSANNLPAGWTKVTIGGRTSRDIEWELCVECTSKQMTFGNITWGAA